MECVDKLKKKNRIIGKPLTLEEMLNPIEETVIGESPYQFEGGDEEIVAKVKYDMAVEKGEIIVVDSDESEDEEEAVDNGATAQEVVKMCEDLEGLCIRYGSAETSLTLANNLRKFRIHLRQEMMKGMKQTTLESWVGLGASK